VARIPAVKDRIGASDGTLGLALLGIAAGSLVTMPFAARLCERYSSRRVVTASVVAVAAALTLLAHAPDALVLAALLTLYGGAFGVMDVAMNVQAVALVRRTGRPIMPWFHAGFSLGGLAGAGLGGLAAGLDVAPSWHFLAVGLVLMTAGLAVHRHYLPDPADPTPDAADAADAAGVGDRAPARTSGRAVPLWLIAGLGAVAACATLTEGAMADWTTLFLRDVRDLDAGLAAVGFAAFSVTMTAGRLGGEAAIRRFGPVRVLRFGGLSSATGIVLATAVPAPVAGIAGFALVGAGMCCVFPLALTTAGEAGAGSGSREIARVSVIGYVGFLVGPPTIGLLSELVGLGGALVALLVPAVGLLLLAPLVDRTPSSARRHHPDPALLPDPV
jgi:MFS family permease